MQKLYCYVDETGQDTAGDIFIVSIVLTGSARGDLLRLCETIEAATGKGIRKWHRTNYQTRLAYLRRLLAELKHEGVLCYSVFRGISNYDEAAVRAIAETINAHKPGEKYTALIYIVNNGIESPQINGLKCPLIIARNVRSSVLN